MVTLKHINSPYQHATPLANGMKTFDMCAPTMHPNCQGLLVGLRYASAHVPTRSTRSTWAVTRQWPRPTPAPIDVLTQRTVLKP